MLQPSIIQKDHSTRVIKCVVWDLDNTLWDGTLVEDKQDAMLVFEHDLTTIAPVPPYITLRLEEHIPGDEKISA